LWFITHTGKRWRELKLYITDVRKLERKSEKLCEGRVVLIDESKFSGYRRN
jgi:hypothetical protein